MSDLENEIKNVIQKSLGVENVEAEADFTKDLKIDSIAKMELLMALEDEFDVKIADEDALKMTSIKATVELLENLKNSKK